MKLQKVIIVLSSIIGFVAGVKVMLSTIEVVNYVRFWVNEIRPTVGGFPPVWKLTSFKELGLYLSVIFFTILILAVGNWIMSDEPVGRNYR